MILELKQSRVVEAPCSVTFEKILDQDGLPSFTQRFWIIPRVERVELFGAEKLEVGIIRRVQFSHGLSYSEVITVLEHGSVSRMRYKVVTRFPFPIWSIAISGEGEYLVQPHARGSIATWSSWVSLRSRLFYPLGLLFRNLFVHQAMQRYLAGVAKAAEQEHPQRCIDSVFPT